MTRMISKEIIKNRVLYNPEPSNFVAKKALIDLTIQRCRLSDFIVVAFRILINAKYLKKTWVDWFETVYHARNGSAQIRIERKHEGHAALAPDGTIMVINHYAKDEAGNDTDEIVRVEPWDGGSGEPYGEWTIETVVECEGYEEWLEDLKWGQNIHDLNDAAANTPYPNIVDCNSANRLADARLTPQKLKEKKEKDAKRMKAGRKDIELENVERKKRMDAAKQELALEEAEQSEAEDSEEAHQTKKGKQQASKFNTPRQKSSPSAAVRKQPSRANGLVVQKPRPEQQSKSHSMGGHGTAPSSQRRARLTVDSDDDEEDWEQERSTKRRKKNDSQKPSMLLIDRYENDKPEDLHDYRSGSKVRRHADEMEVEFEGYVKQYSNYLDSKFSHPAETEYRKRKFLGVIKKRLKLSDEELGSEEQSSRDEFGDDQEGIEESGDEEEESSEEDGDEDDESD